MGKNIISVAVEPAASPVVSQTLNGEEIKPGPHKIQGIGAGFIPDTLDLSVVDRVELLDDDEAMEFALRLAREEGILSGVSSGAAAAVAIRLGKLSEFAGKLIVAILPDSGERYDHISLFVSYFNIPVGFRNLFQWVASVWPNLAAVFPKGRGGRPQRWRNCTGKCIISMYLPLLK